MWEMWETPGWTPPLGSNRSGGGAAHARAAPSGRLRSLRGTGRGIFTPARIVESQRTAQLGSATIQRGRPGARMATLEVPRTSTA